MMRPRPVRGPRGQIMVEYAVALCLLIMVMVSGYYIVISNANGAIMLKRQTLSTAANAAPTPQVSPLS